MDRALLGRVGGVVGAESCSSSLGARGTQGCWGESDCVCVLLRQSWVLAMGV